jgi:hypothetical protein
MMWEGIFDEEDQMTYMVNVLREFQTTGKQLLIEKVDFNEEAPIFDYGNR